jgi:hypothetical protein
MFKLAPSPTYWWEVTLLQVQQDGSIEAMPIDVQFRRLTVEEHAALLQEATDEQMLDPEVARRLVTNWRKVVDGDGAELPFNEGTFGQLLNVPGVGSTLVGEFLISRDQGALGNLKRSRGAGSAAAASSATAKPTTK